MGFKGRLRPSRPLRDYLATASAAVTTAVLTAAPAASARPMVLGVNTTGDLCSGDACGQNIIKLGEGLMFYALIVATAGIMVSAMLWAVGSKGQNPGTELAGKRGMIVCCTAAFLIGALGPWLGFLETTANDVSNDAKGG